MPGVPISLTKPEFTIVETPVTATKSKFQVTRQWVADPDEQYVINIDPSLFSESDLTLKFGAHGEVKTANAEQRDQIAPTVAATAEFVAAAIGLSGVLNPASVNAPLVGPNPIILSPANKHYSYMHRYGAALSSITPVLRDIARDLILHRGRVLVWDPTSRPSVAAKLRSYLKCPRPKTPQENHWREPTGAELREFFPLLRDLLSRKPLETLTPFSPQRLIWLTTAARVADCRVNRRRKALAVARSKRAPAAKVAQELFDQFLPDRSSWGPSQQSAFVALLAWLRDGNAPAASLKSGSPFDVFLKAFFVCNLRPAISIEDAECKFRPSLTALARSYDAAKKQEGRLKKELTWQRLLKYLVAIHDSDRLTRIKELERKIAAQEVADVVAGRGAPSRALTILRKRWLVAIGAYQEGVRERQLLQLLASSPRPGGIPGIAQAQAVRDYAIAAGELAKIRTVIAQKRVAQRPVVTPTPKGKEKKHKARFLTYPERGRSNANWVGSVIGLDNPEFVIVLERGHVK